MSEPRIVLDPNVLLGKPTIRGTRLSVELILEFLASGWSFDDLLDSYPGLTREDVSACLDYAREAIALERAFPSAVETACVLRDAASPLLSMTRLGD